MSDTFCALPFRHLCIGPEGTARVCCVTNDLVTEHGAPMSLNVHTMDEIWNSAYMRNIRRGMLKGERISACETCYQSEAASGQSYRMSLGLQPIKGQPVSRTRMNGRGSSKTGFRIDERPNFIKLEIGNLCNLKCRMCYSAASSQIERDPVASEWSGGAEPLHAVWRGKSARIGPEPRIGVRTSGVAPQEFIDGAARCWTDGHAIFSVPLQVGTHTTKLDISFHPAGIQGQHFQVVINGRPRVRGVLENANAPVSIDLTDLDNPVELSIEILSNKIIESAGQPERGLPLSGLILHRQWTASSNSVHPQLLSPRLGFDRPWYLDDRKIFDDVLKSADELDYLYVTGGEPLINDRFGEILDFLHNRGAAQHIDLELSTNCTQVDEQIIDRFRNFRHVKLNLSLDAVGETFEYIRYPARWSVVEANVRKLTDHHRLFCVANPVVQIYNILSLVPLYRYCAAANLKLVTNVLYTPDRLAIHNLPPRVRKKAAARLFEYHDADCRTADKATVLSLARYLDQITSPENPEIIREFMIFTNDLDATRGQSIRRTNPELVQLFAEDGYVWTDETWLAKGDLKKRPARTRDFTWL